MPKDLPQAVAHRVINGGCKTPKRIAKQIGYLARKLSPSTSKGDVGEGSKSAVKLRLSARYGEEELKHADIDKFAESWALQSGIYQPGQSEADSKKELTTHFAVSFPPGTPLDAAENAGLEWARILFHSGRFGAEWDYVTAFHTDREHPHTHIVVNRRGFPPENSRASTMGKWLKIAHRYEPDKALAAQNGKEFGINYKILRDVQVEAAAKFGIFLEATSRKDRGLDSPSLTHGQYRQQQKLGVGEVKEHWGYIPEEVFGDLLSENPSRSSPQGSSTAGQSDAQQGGGSSGGAASSRDLQVDQRSGAAMRQEGIAAGEPMDEDVEPGQEQMQERHDGLFRPELREGEEIQRISETLKSRSATDTSGQSGAQNVESGSGPVHPRGMAIDPDRRQAAERERRARAVEHRNRSADEPPSRRKTPDGVESQAIDPRRKLAAAYQRMERAAEQRNRDANEGPARRKTPGHGVLENIAEPGGGGDVRATAAGRRSPRGKPRNQDVERIIETRAQKARREQMEAERSTAPPHGMELRNTPSRQARAQRDQRSQVEHDQDGNTRPGKQRSARGRRSNRRSSR